MVPFDALRAEHPLNERNILAGVRHRSVNQAARRDSQ